jgi:hypothetical protein
MGWKYEEYLSQPTWFILMLMELLQAEVHEANRRSQ